MRTFNTYTTTTQTPPMPPGIEAFAVRSMAGWYEHPAFDVVWVDPITWHCFYIDDSLVSTQAEAQLLADAYNRGTGILQPLQLVSLDH